MTDEIFFIVAENQKTKVKKFTKIGILGGRQTVSYVDSITSASSFITLEEANNVKSSIEILQEASIEEAKYDFMKPDRMIYTLRKYKIVNL